jgi:hypothetical protein
MFSGKDRWSLESESADIMNNANGGIYPVEEDKILRGED